MTAVNSRNEGESEDIYSSAYYVLPPLGRDETVQRLEQHRSQSKLEYTLEPPCTFNDAKQDLLRLLMCPERVAPPPPETAAASPQLPKKSETLLLLEHLGTFKGPEPKKPKAIPRKSKKPITTADGIDVLKGHTDDDSMRMMTAAADGWAVTSMPGTPALPASVQEALLKRCYSSEFHGDLVRTSNTKPTSCYKPVHNCHDCVHLHLIAVALFRR